MQHNFMRLVEIFLYVVLNPSQPFWSRGKFFFSLSVSDGQSSCGLMSSPNCERLKLRGQNCQKGTIIPYLNDNLVVEHLWNISGTVAHATNNTARFGLKLLVANGQANRCKWVGDFLVFLIVLRGIRTWYAQEGYRGANAAQSP